MKRLVFAAIDYLLGFMALAIFAAVAFSAGAPTDDRLIGAFKIGAVLAAAGLTVWLARAAPANRLIMGANLWLLAGGGAAFTGQWWWLKGYQRMGEASLFLSTLVLACLRQSSPPPGSWRPMGPGARWSWPRGPC